MPSSPPARPPDRAPVSMERDADRASGVLPGHWLSRKGAPSASRGKQTQAETQGLESCPEATGL